MDCKKAQSLVTSYITRKLNDKDLEEFLEHIDTCDECYEELEIYYTVHYTLARLDKDETGQVYNVKKALQNRLEESRFYVWRTKVSRIYRMGIMMLAEMLLVLILMAQVDLWQYGTIEHNPISQFLSMHSEKPAQKQTETQKKKSRQKSKKKKQTEKTTEKTTERATEKVTEKQQKKQQNKVK